LGGKKKLKDRFESDLKGTTKNTAAAITIITSTT
jgi:hypothetical protein